MKSAACKMPAKPAPWRWSPRRSRGWLARERTARMRRSKPGYKGWGSLAVTLIVVSTPLRAATELPVYPKDAASLPPVELSALIVAALPSQGARYLGWDHMLDAPVLWLTDGFAESPGGKSERVGLARVRVN